MAEGKIHSSPDVKNYFLVIHSFEDPFGENQANFGVDAKLSDRLTQHAYVALGGPQSTFQFANMVKNGSMFSLLYGREMRAERDRKFISTAEFATLAAVLGIKELTQEDAILLTDAMLRVKPMWPNFSMSIDADSKPYQIQQFKKVWIDDRAYRDLEQEKLQLVLVDAPNDLADLENTLNKILEECPENLRRKLPESSELLEKLKQLGIQQAL
jgi:hypothetical protein